MNENVLIIACPLCQRALELPRRAAGRTVLCPVCLGQFHSLSAVEWSEHQRAKRNAQISWHATDTSAELLVVEAEESSNRQWVTAPNWTEYCPLCETAVPPYLDCCPGCRAEFLPLEESEERPWETHGVERRDCQPHHGGKLMVMSIVSVALSPLTFCLCTVGVLFALVGITFGIITIVQARRDLRQMREGTMHCEGRGLTQCAFALAIVGIALNVVAMIPALLMLAAALR